MVSGVFCLGGTREENGVPGKALTDVRITMMASYQFHSLSSSALPPTPNSIDFQWFSWEGRGQALAILIQPGDHPFAGKNGEKCLV